MEHRYSRLEERPELPETLPHPPLELEGSPWFELQEPDDVRVLVTFTGNGRPPTGLYVGWLYVLPLEGEELRRPTLEEIYEAAGKCELEGVMWELPPFRSGRSELPEGADGLLVHFRQMGAEQGSPAASRFQIAAASAGAGLIQPGSVN